MRYAAILTLLICASLSFAQKPVPSNPLETPATFWDQAGTGMDLGDRVIDTRDGHLQCVSELSEGPYSGQPEAAARAFLQMHKDWVGFDPSPANLVAVRTAETPMGHHVTFERVINGVPVYPGDLVVTLDKQNLVRFYFSSLIALPSGVVSSTTLNAQQALSAAMNYLAPKTFYEGESAKTDLVIWAGDNRDFVPCWRVRQPVQDPRGDWEVLVDANNGQIRRVKDRICYIDGTGNTYHPDPLTSAGVNYNTAGYVDGNDANTTQLTAQVFLDTLRDITLIGTTYNLRGPYCYMEDWDPPTSPINTATNPDSFRFLRQAQGFEDVNVYANIDRSQRYIQSLGFTSIQNLPIHADGHGVNGDDNSYFMPSNNKLAFGEGGVDDAEDCDVIWHEYGHAMQKGMVSSWGGGDEPAMGEGFGDYWAGSYSHMLYTFHDRWVYNWDGHNPFWPGRTLNANLHYPNGGEIHDVGMIWSQACFESNLDLGREYMDQMVLQHHYLIGAGATMTTAARAIVTVDQTEHNGADLWSIYARFQPRGLLSAPPAFALLSPLGGDLWPLNSTVTVTWVTGMLHEGVKIELSRDGGTNWETLADSVPNTGRADLTVSAARTDSAWVKITFLGTPTHTDQSDSNFVITGAMTLLSEDFENSAPQWTHEAASGWTDQWNLSSQRTHGGAMAYKCGAVDSTVSYATHMDSRLISPVINGLPAHAMLEFWHQIEAETATSQPPDTANDGGLLEIAVNGGGFTQIYPPVNGYNSMIRRGVTPSGPFARGTQVWSSNISQWTKVVCNLAAFAGDTVQFRFRFGSNATSGRQGWFVDDVKLIGPSALLPPSRVTCRSVNGQIVLRWAPSQDPHYRVYSSPTADGLFETLEGTTDTTVFTVPASSDMMKFFIVKGWDGTE